MQPLAFRRNSVKDEVQTRDDNAMQAIESIGVLVYPQVSEQDSITPVEIFKGAAMVLRGDISPWPRSVAPEELHVEMVSLDPGVVTMQMGTQVVPDRSLHDDDLFDIFYIPGGVGSGALLDNQRLISLIRRHYDEGKVVAANCSGVGVLARAGVLEDRLTTSVAAIGRGLREEGFNSPETRRMWVGHPDQRVWTATGSYGVNGSSVAMVAHYFGREIGTIVAMMFDTLAGLGDVIFEPIGPEFYVHKELEESFQNLFQPMLFPSE